MTKILLVEDDKSLREIYGVRLLAEGYDIVSAGDGEEALAMAIKEKPSLIISDVMMPKISGFDMLDILRSTTETRDIKVIMMTALSSEDQRSRGEQLGSDRYLVKSQVGIEDVVRTVHDVLEDTPGASGIPKPAEGQPAAAPAASDSSSTTSTDSTSDANSDDVPAETPAPAADDAVMPASEDPAADDTAKDEPAADASDVAEKTSVAPGSEAGPLPPQPVDLKPAEPTDAPAESTLPQPTAPFSSPPPSSLGEQIVEPIHDDPMAVTKETSEKIDQELSNEATPAAPMSVPVRHDTDDGSTPPSSDETGVSATPVEEPVAPAEASADTPAPATDTAAFTDDTGADKPAGPAAPAA